MYKGKSDQYVDGLDKQPACEKLGRLQYGLSAGGAPPAWSITCAQLDLDFGASPNLFTDSFGNTIVGELQKAGVYHAIHAGTMERAWSAIIGPPCAICSADSTATNGSSVFGVGTPPGQMVSLSTDGGYQWVAPVADAIHYQSITTANGVVYTADTAGNLNAFDASSGVLLAKRPVSADAKTSVAGYGSNGVSVARHTIYVAIGTEIVAYRLPEA